MNINRYIREAESANSLLWDFYFCMVAYQQVSLITGLDWTPKNTRNKLRNHWKQNIYPTAPLYPT